MKKIYFIILLLVSFTVIGQNNFVKKIYGPTVIEIKGAISTSDGGFAFLDQDYGKLIKLDSLYDIEFISLQDTFSPTFNYIIQTTDSGYITNHSPYNDSCRIGIIKLNKNGDFLWAKDYSINLGFLTGSLPTTNNEFYLSCNNATIIKCDEFGNIIWQKSPSVYNEFYQFEKINESLFFIAGTNLFYLIDSSGNYLSAKHFSDSAYYFTDAIKTNDGGISVLGYNMSQSKKKAVIFHLDTSLNLLWAKQIESSDTALYFNLSSFEQLDNGNYMIGGYDCYPTTTSLTYSIYLKTDSNGNVEWSRETDYGDINWFFEENNSVYGFTDYDFVKLDETGSGFCGYDSIQMFSTDITGNFNLEDTTISSGNTNFESQDTIYSFYSENDSIETICMNISASVNDLNNLPEIKIYPNPSSGIFTIQGDKLNEIMVFNTVGQMIERFQLNGKDFLKINLSNQPKGLYLVKIKADKGVFVGKIIIR